MSRMKKMSRWGQGIMIAILVIALLLSMIPSIFAAEAASTKAASASEAGILPTNSFYFVKELGRGLKKAFSFNPVSKLRYELAISEAKALELQKLAEVLPNNLNGIGMALHNYGEGLIALNARLKGIDPADASRLGEFFDEAVLHVIRQEMLLDSLGAKYPDLREEIDGVRDSIGEIVSRVAGASDEAAFMERIHDALDVSGTAELEAALALIRLSQKLPEGEAGKKLRNAEETLFLDLEAKLKVAGTNADIGNMVGALRLSEEGKLIVVERFREIASVQEVRNGLNALRPALIGRSEGIDAPEAQAAIREANNLIGNLSSLVKSKAYVVPKSVLDLLEKARFTAGDAESFYRAGSFASAFAQANAAASAVSAAVSQLQKKGDTLTEESTELKALFDSLMALIREKGITKEHNPLIFQVAGKAEKAIIAVKRIEDVQAVRKLLSEIKALVNASLNLAIQPPEVKGCTREFMPVCGKNGKTYSNACLAENEKTGIAYEGECRRPDAMFMPLCAKDYEAHCSDMSGGSCRKWECRSIDREKQADPSSRYYEFTLEADDGGFYPNSLVVSRGSRVKIDFLVKASNVRNSLEFRSDKFKTDPVNPGASTVVEFTAEEPLVFYSYWPGTDIIRGKGSLIIKE